MAASIKCASRLHYGTIWTNGGFEPDGWNKSMCHEPRVDVL